MKYLPALFVLLFASNTSYSQAGTDSLLNELNKAINSSKVYDAEKLKTIASVKKTLTTSNNGSLPFKYATYLKLYEEYRLFNFDSAFVFAKKLEETAYQLNDPLKIADANIKTAFILLSAGMFLETFDKLNNIDLKEQPDSLKAKYYSLTGRYYYDLADYDNDAFYTPRYVAKGNQNMDSALLMFPANSFGYYFYHGLKSLKQANTEKAFSDYLILLNQFDLKHHELALVTSTLSIIYLKKGDIQKAIDYQIRAAVADIKSSTKETFAIFNLAGLLYQEGDVENASLYIEQAIANASFYNAKLRKVQVSTLLPIIQAKKISRVESQRKLWIIYGAIATIFVIVLGFLFMIIKRQYNKLKEARKTIIEANANLNEANLRLLEANKIKEEYIGYFLNSNSEVFQKMVQLKKLIERKVSERKYDDIKLIVNNFNSRQEKEDLLKAFDKIFVRLFPNFIPEFNSLLREEDQIKLKEDEIMNTDLRIFALIRMGINENEKIAQILGYSVNTIYTYKAKIKNRATVGKDEFEKKIMSIRSV